MSYPLNQALLFNFQVRRMSDGTRFQPASPPTVDTALYPDQTVITPTPVLTWDAANLQYTYTLPADNVTQSGPYYIAILVDDPLASSLAYDQEFEVQAEVVGLTAAEVWEYATRTLTSFAFSTEVTLTSMVNETGDIPEIFQGSDYYESEDRALIWTFSGLDLTSAEAVFNVSGQSFVGVVDANANTVTVELPAAQTSLMTLGRDKYALIITFGNGHRTVVVKGHATVYPEPS